MEEHRKISNLEKLRIIKYATENIRDKNKDEFIYLLDICCGRGGDIHKWSNLKINKVIGFDNHKESIQEAIDRYKKISKKTKTKISFLYKDVQNVKLNIFSKYYKPNIISCQFAIHYVENLNSFIKQISQNIKTGGYFIGTAPDGDIINFNLENNINIQNLYLEKINNDQYKINIKNTTEVNRNSAKTKDYFEYRNYSTEYFVKKNTLVNICKQHNLMLQEIKNLKTQENTISNIYFSFIFLKV